MSAIAAIGMLVLAFAVAGLADAGVVAEEPYAWPLTLPRDLSSSFGEYRAGRFHAGIDLRTGGVIGKPVYAAGDGYISRVRCSPFGYGKALYVQLRDGNLAVYAHLDDFEDHVRAYVRRHQHERRSYTVDLYPQPGQFPVKRGERIATSGRTGGGPPHLHYELRDGANRPFNPRLIGIQWPDTTPPVIRKILVAPDGESGAVEGGFVPRVLDVVHHGNGVYVSEPVTVSGRIGIGVDVIDPGNDGLRFGVHVLRLLHGAREIFRVQHDYLSYDNMHNGAVAYHPFFLDQGRFLLLWRWPGNESPPYAVSAGDGFFEMTDGAAELVVEAIDFAGNLARLTLPLVSPSAPEDECMPRETEATGQGQFSMSCYGEYLVGQVRFDAPESQPPELLVESGATLVSRPFSRVDERVWQVAYRAERGGRHIFRVHHPRVAPDAEIVHIFMRGETARTYEEGELSIAVQPDSPYGSLFLRIEPEASPPGGGESPAGRAWKIWPHGMPVDRMLTLAIRLPADAAAPHRAGIYHHGGRGWRHVGGKRVGDALEANVRGFGVYAIMEDVTPPQISDVLPQSGYRAQTARPIVRAIIRDTGSGIAEFSITANGVWLLAVYDPDENRLEWERDHDLPSGDQEVVFRVADSAGNIATASRTVTVP